MLASRQLTKAGLGMGSPSGLPRFITQVRAPRHTLHSACGPEGDPPFWRPRPPSPVARPMCAQCHMSCLYMFLRPCSPTYTGLDTEHRGQKMKTPEAGPRCLVCLRERGL